MNLKTIVISVLGLWLISAGEAWPDNLLRYGDFDSLEPWTANGNLQENGSVTLLPADQGVTIQNPVIDLDGSLYQDIATEGHESFSYSVRIKGGGMMRASLGFVAFDAAGDVLAIETPTKVSGTKWTTHSGTVRVPPSTARLRTLLSVLDGKCSFANLELRKFEPSAQKRRIERSTPGIGFSVTEMPVDRPFWELFCDDLNGDGNPEIVGCDVDGLVTIRNQGTSASVAFPAGALVYQFAAADVDGDGVKEVLMSSVDPKIPLRAMNLQGNLVRVFQSSRGPERIEVCDMDGDGTPEVAASVGNGVPGSGVAAGVVLFDNQGKKLWEKAETLRTFRFGNLGSEGKPALVVGGARSEFYVYDKEGGQLERFSLNTGLLEQFQLTDLDGDHAVEIIASGWLGNRFRLICRGPKGAIWDADIPSDIGGGGSSCSAWH
ncbi:MAG: FG-GAP-like repeat-containing protein, partial [Planctomycetota bacterium]